MTSGTSIDGKMVQDSLSRLPPKLPHHLRPFQQLPDAPTLDVGTTETGSTWRPVGEGADAAWYQKSILTGVWALPILGIGLLRQGYTMLYELVLLRGQFFEEIRVAGFQAIGPGAIIIKQLVQPAHRCFLRPSVC